MKIAVDASQINSVYTGVGRYLYNLLKYMAPLSPDIEYTLFISSDSNHKLNFSNIKKILLPTDRRNLYWQNIVLNKALKNGNYDFLWSPNYYSPILYKGRSLISMHDVSWRALPDNYPFINRMVRNLLSKHTLKKASVVFTLSEFSKKEIIGHYKTNPDLIKVIHLAIDDSFKKSEPKQTERFKEKYGITKGPVLGYLGSIFKRRNIGNLISSFQSLKTKHPDLKLMLVGENHDPNIEILLSNDPSIIWVKRVDENEIKDFYSSIDLFVYISDYEGFGLPPLEALSCGTVPLLLSKTSLKEIYTDIALFIKEPEVELIVNKISYFLEYNKKISEKILTNFKKREKYFSWERVANDYIKIFEELKHSNSSYKDS